MSVRQSLGKWFDNQRLKHARAWLIGFIVWLVLLVVLNFFIHPHHPHFGVDKYTGFWAVFGFFVAAVMGFAMKELVQPVIKVEDQDVDSE